MHGRIPWQALELPAHVNEAPGLLIFLIFLPEIGIFLERLVERNVELLRDHLRDAVALGVRQVERAPNVADDAAGRHRAERDDLHDAVSAVLLHDVVDDLLAPLEAEVDVDIGHRDTLRVQEPLENEIIFQRIELRDPEAVRHD